jgi:hypothetical protein
VWNKHCNGDNDSKLDRNNAFYHGASGGMYALRTALLEIEPGVIGALRASPFCEFFRPGNLVNEDDGAGSTWAKVHFTRSGHELFSIPL